MVHASAKDLAHVQVEPGTNDDTEMYIYMLAKNSSKLTLVHADRAHVFVLQVEPGTIWCFEQEQSLAGLNVTTTIRMTVVKLQNGDLLVYAPIAPTR